MTKVNTIQLKYLTKIPITTGASKEGLEFDSNKTRYIRISDFDKNGRIKPENKVSIENCDAQDYLLVDGDILAAVTGGTVGKTMIFNSKDVIGDAAYAGYLARIRMNENLNNKYLYYMMNCPYFDRFRGENINKSTIENISASKYKSFPVLMIDYEKQEKIVSFLDEKINIIDELIRNMELQILDLEKNKYATITKCCFLGLDAQKSVDNDVPYIKKISNDFEICKIGQIFEVKKDIIGREPDVVLSITQKGIVIKDIKSNEGQQAESYSSYQIVNVGDFAMNHMDLLTGWIDISNYEGVTSPDYRVFKIKNTMFNPRYFLYVFQDYYKRRVFYGFGQGVSNYGRWRLPANNFKNIYIPVPPLEKQNLIVKYLDDKCKAFDDLILLKQRKIQLFEEYKKSLIYEYVTGKKEVC